MAYKTRQRDAIWEVIDASAQPLTAQAIRQRAAQRVKGLGIATVYRTLKQLVEEGQVKHIELAGAQPHYESSARHHHHFFLCEKCKHVFDMMGCLRGIPNLLPKGYHMRRHEIVIYGDCAGCSTFA
ncbi:MAG TPA: transcriptional repressor [Terrimicrobiaceae bacterium]